jgi:hypothetical protein
MLFFEDILYFNRFIEVDGTPYRIFSGVSKITGDHSPIQSTDSLDGQPYSIYII